MASSSSISLSASRPISLRKRRNEEICNVKGSCGSPPRKITYFYMLESESDISSDERTESIHSIQDKSTDYAKDTSDTSTKSEDSDHDCSEYEVMSLDSNELENPFEDCDSLSSGTDTAIIKAVTISALCDEDDNLDSWADSSSVSSEGGELDPELSPADFWTCAQCKNTNNNPLFRYCEKCFKVRKNFFPPRPHGKKKRKSKSKGKNSLDYHLSSGIADSGISSALENQKSFDSSLPTDCSPSTSGEQIFSSTTMNHCVISYLNEEKSFNKNNSIETECDVSMSEDKKFHTENDRSKDISNSVEMNDLEINKNHAETTDSDKVNCQHSVINALQENSCTDVVNKCTAQASNGSECGNDIVEPPTNQEPLCSTCLINSKNGIFVHGSWAHIYSCYKCSMKIWKKSGRCPICKAKVSQVLKGVVAY